MEKNNKQQTDVAWIIGEQDNVSPLTSPSNAGPSSMQQSKAEPSSHVDSDKTTNRSSRSSSDETPNINIANVFLDESSAQHSAASAIKNNNSGSTYKRNSNVDSFSSSLNYNRSSSLVGEVSPSAFGTSGRKYDLGNSLDMNMSTVLFNSSSGVELKLSRNDSQSSSRSPNKEIVPKMNKSRNDKFHKLFKSIPEDEMCLKGYSCAYMGDILLQGYLYISPNWFCFHSKILGIEKQIKIQVHNVLNITREKTAIFIPNAVGIVTSEDKYVFGSLMSRDNTYRIMFAVWKSLMEPGSLGEAKLPAVLQQLPDDLYSDNNNVGRDRASIDDSESDVSICMQCGLALHEHSNEAVCGSVSESLPDTTGSPQTNGEERDTALPDTAGSPDTATISPSAPHNVASSSQHKMEHSDQESNVSLVRLQPRQNTDPDDVSQVDENGGAYVPCKLDPVNQQTSVMNATFHKKTAKTNYMLLVCILMVIILTLASVIMLHKIAVLQAILQASPASAPVLQSDKDVYSSIYYLNHEYHIANIKRFHSVLEANINVLNQIHSSFKTLQLSVSDMGGCANHSTIPTSPQNHGET